MTPASGRSLKDLGEFGLIGELTQRFGQSDAVVIGPGDDAAAVRTGSVTVVSLDLLVQDRHFRLDWSSASDVGHKAAAANLSDINAMGGRATALLVGLAAPASLEAAWALDLADGIAAEAEKVGASVVGGDVTQAERITIAISVLGECPHGPVRRSGARPGDVVAHAGRQGWADAGYAVLARGFRSPRAVVDAHRRPEPPYGAGAAAAEAGATAMIDVSDGMLQDLGHIAEASGVAVDVDSGSFEVAEPIQAVGAALGVEPTRLVLTGGDDYGLLATFPPGIALPDRWRPVGRVLADGTPGAVTVDGEPYEEAAGHRHFS
jgi:thiamine-monophosphate kinase